MKLTSQEEYGLRCLLSLARQQDAASEGGTGAPSNGAEESAPPGDAVPLVDIATAEGISEQYAGKLLRMLADSGIVESVRGRSGGFRLARAPEEISVAAVLAALGDQIYEETTCERFRGNQPFCIHTNDCSLRSLWSGLQIIVDHVLSRTSLRDLIGRERTVEQWMQMQIQALSELAERQDSPPSTDGARMVEWAPTVTATRASTKLDDD